MFLIHYIYLNFAASVFLYVNGDAVANETNGECLLPNHPQNGKWMIIGGSDAHPGSAVPSRTAITFFCDNLYRVSSDYITITCLGKNWNLPSPKCLNGEETNKVKRAVIVSRNRYGDVVAIRNTDDQKDNRYVTQGGRGGDGIVIESGGRRAVIGSGERGSSYYDERGVARGGQGGTGVIKGGLRNTGQKGVGGQTYYGEGRRGQDGLVIGPGETVNGYGIGFGQPGGSGQRKGGRGGSGVVVDRGQVNGDLIGLGGPGGYSKGSNNRQGGYGQARRTDSGYYDGSEEQTADWIGGRGGDGVVIRNGRIRGNIVGIGGPGGSGGYYRRKRKSLNPPILADCGERRTREIIVDGKNVKKTIYPWATAIYKNISGNFTYICAATMLTPKIFVTVAHCVTSQDGNPIPVQELKIAVGKYYQDYNDAKDTQAQFSDIMKVLVNPDYKGDVQNFASDMAFLVTKDQLALSKVVQPVCYQNIRNIVINDGTEGVLTGWGFPDATTGSLSKEVQGIPLPFQNKETCIRDLPKNFRERYVTYDKMCTGQYNKSMNFCLGVSGNGLTFPYNGRYYIRGVIGIGMKGDTDDICNRPAKTTLYTNVSTHYEWLESVVTQYK